MIAAVINGKNGTISAVVNGKSFTVPSDHKNYDQIIQSIKDQDDKKFISLVDIVSSVLAYTKNGVEIKNGVVFYNGTPLHNTLTNRILDFISKGLPFKPLVNFLNNLLENPSYRAVNELYDFLEAGDLPITEDGHFLAFKNVKSDYKDIHSGTFDNSVGQKLSVSRNTVDEDANRTCSTGLHFCSIKYLPHFSDADGGHTMILKINPKDVVAIPADYNNTKGRCCAYEVIDEYKEDWRSKIEKNENGFNSSLYDEDGNEYKDDDCCDCEDCQHDQEDNEEVDNLVDKLVISLIPCMNPWMDTTEMDEDDKDSADFGKKPSGDRYYQVRDSKGKFVKKQ